MPVYCTLYKITLCMYHYPTETVFVYLAQFWSAIVSILHGVSRLGAQLLIFFHVPNMNDTILEGNWFASSGNFIRRARMHGFGASRIGGTKFPVLFDRNIPGGSSRDFRVTIFVDLKLQGFVQFYGWIFMVFTIPTW